MSLRCFITTCRLSLFTALVIFRGANVSMGQAASIESTRNAPSEWVAASAPDGGSRLVSTESCAAKNIGAYAAGGLSKQIDLIDIEQDELFKAGVTQGRSLSVFDQPRNTWDAGFAVKSDAAIAKGERVLIGFWVRGVALNDAGESVGGDGGVIELVFEKGGPPHTKSVQYLVETEPDNAWKHVWVRCESRESYAAGEANIGFQLGYRRQRVEIAGVEVWKYPADRSLKSLPMSPRTYMGRQQDAAWRVAAEKRIEQIRKCDLNIRLIDAAGDPVVGKTMHLQQTRHAFRFGTAVSCDMVQRQDDDGDQYRRQLKRLFNIGTIENGLKWRSWDSRGATRHDQVLTSIDWLNKNQIAVRGHVMIWPSERNSPPWISSLYDKPDVLKQVINTHIREMGFATKGKVADWDVVNEAFDNDEFEQHLGPGCFTEFFQEAEAVLPNSDLYYNDYAGLVRAGVNTYHKDHFEMIIRRLIDEGAPIDGIGIQGHFGEILTPPHRIVRELDRWGQFDLKVLITEFDLSVPDQDLMADFTRDFLTACFSHPSVDGIMTWGFWAGAHWRPEAALFDQQWNPTPMGERWIELTTKRWQSSKVVSLDASGSTPNLRVFKGNYQVQVGDQTWDIVATDDSDITLQMN